MDEIMSYRFKVVQWPETQEMMEREGFAENSLLINDGLLYNEYGDAAYMVREEWLDEEPCNCLNTEDTGEAAPWPATQDDIVDLAQMLDNQEQTLQRHYERMNGIDQAITKGALWILGLGLLILGIIAHLIYS